MDMLHAFVQNNGDGNIARINFLMKAFTEELLDELAEKDELVVGAMLAQMGLVIEWVGHGNNAILPDSLRPFADSVQPQPVPVPDPEPELESIAP